MEYCGGGSVSDLIQAADSQLDEDVISFICAETLAGLAYLHGLGKVAFSKSTISRCGCNLLCVHYKRIMHLRQNRCNLRSHRAHRRYE